LIIFLGVLKVQVDQSQRYLAFLSLTPAPRRSLGDELDAGLTERAR
jgi:hypothetical protein